MAVPATVSPGSPAFTDTTIGRKVVMAVTGIILFGFVLVHMLGNLQVYQGEAVFNHYSDFLHELIHGMGLWVARVVLLASVILHIWAAWTTTRRSWAARPIGYKVVKRRESTYASRTMRWGGGIILLFVFYHLADFTFGAAAIHPSFVPHNPYVNFVNSFSRWPVALLYIVANIALGFHLRHGVWSLCQTLGLAHPRYKAYAVAFALLFALVVTLGNVSFPIAVLTGVVHL